MTINKLEFNLKDDFKTMTDTELIKLHANAHEVWGAFINSKKNNVPPKNMADFLDAHKQIAKEMIRRGIEHQPRDELDKKGSPRTQFVPLCCLAPDVYKEKFDYTPVKNGELLENIAKKFLKCLKCKSTYVNIQKMAKNGKLLQMGCVECGNRFYVYDGREKYKKIFVIEKFEEKNIDRVPAWDDRYIDLLDEEKHFYAAMTGWYNEVADYYNNKKLAKYKLSKQKLISPTDADFSWKPLHNILKGEMILIALKGQNKGLKDLGKKPTNTLDKDTENAIDTYSMKLAKEVTDDTNNVVKGIIKEGLKEKMGVADIRRAIVAGVKIDALTSNVAAKRVKGKVVRKAYERTISSVVRSRSIAQTETMRAANMGRFNAVKDDKLVIGWKFLASADDRTCQICLGLDGKRYKMDDTTNMPPNPHTNCRCTFEEILIKRLSALEKFIDTSKLVREEKLMNSSIKLKSNLKGEKLASPLMELPPENKKMKFVIQSHWRGKSEHKDLRFEVDGYLTGWTLFDAPAGVVKNPVVTLPEAKAAENRIKWKINNEPGMRGNKIQAVAKGRMPKEWGKVQGVIKPGQVGATAEYPGVILIDDKGWIEFGAQKSNLHEYFLHGKKYNGRWIVSKIKLPERNADKLQDREVWLAWKTKDQMPYVLGSSAKSSGWVPPKGYSAMSKSWRVKVPRHLRWWEQNLTGAKARTMIDEIRKVLMNRKMSTQSFVFQKRSWKGSGIKWDLRINLDEALDSWEFSSNPLFNSGGAGIHTKAPNNFINLKGDILPNSYGNPDKKLKATIEILDSGDVEIIEKQPLFIHLRFRSKILRGLWVLKRDGANSNLWSMKKSKPLKAGLKDSMDVEIKKLKSNTIHMRIQKFLLEKKVHRKHIVTIKLLEDSHQSNIRRDLKYYSSKNSSIALPLIIEGIALEEGTWTGASGTGVTYPGDVVWKGVPLLKGAQMRLDHDEEHPEKVVGWVIKSWKGTSEVGKKRMMFRAMIFDETTARKLMNKKAFDVSIGVWNKETIVLGNHICEEIHAIDELSIVPRGACETCEAKVVAKGNIFTK